MIYIFEDKSDDLISLLFKAGYDENTASKFIYTKGNGGLVSEVTRQLSALPINERICVFIDMAPGNRELNRIYEALMKQSRKNPNRIIIMPLICAEYYLIKSFIGKTIIKSNIGVEICLNKDIYFNSPLIESQEDKKFCKNFERYCKLILNKNLTECARHSRGKQNDNVMYGMYYTKDCKCDNAMDNCVSESLQCKAFDFLKNYPCIPEGSIFKNKQKYTDVEIRDIHRKLVDEYNAVIENYKLADPFNESKYKRIKYAM